jgi:predicted nucleic acid-binding protein
MSRSFFDTNVLFYACDPTDPVKQEAARELIATASAADQGVVSVSVLGEFFFRHGAGQE